MWTKQRRGKHVIARQPEKPPGKHIELGGRSGGLAKNPWVKRGPSEKRSNCCSFGCNDHCCYVNCVNLVYQRYSIDNEVKQANL